MDFCITKFWPKKNEPKPLFKIFVEMQLVYLLMKISFERILAMTAEF